MRQRKVMIIGGGASGIVSAISAARMGANVTIIEQKDRVGKKILSTGNGRCNLTNEYMSPACFRGDDISIVSEALKQFGYEETFRFFEELGVILKNKQAYIYPMTEQASTILDVLRMELERLQVSVLLEHKVIAIKKNAKGYAIHTDKGIHQGDAVILATGGKAASVLGSDGSGYSLAKQFGHHVSPVVPALVQLRGKCGFFKQIAGVRTQARITLYVDEQSICSDIGELQLTNYGISGIPVFQLSRFAAKALYEKKHVQAEIDFLPSMSDEAFVSYIANRMLLHGYKTAEEFFVGIFNKKLIGMLLKEAKIPFQMVMNNVAIDKLERLLSIFKHFNVEIEATNDFEQAQICAGGIKTTEVNPQTFESMYEADLYLVGELLDIDGICGGYNLQWAWTTGFIAGKHAAKGTKL